MFRRASTPTPKTNWNLTQNFNYLKAILPKYGFTFVKSELSIPKMQFKFVPNSKAKFRYTSLTLKFEVQMALEGFILTLRGLATTVSGEKLPFRMYFDHKDGGLDSKNISEFVVRELSTLDLPYVPDYDDMYDDRGFEHEEE